MPQPAVTTLIEPHRRRLPTPPNIDRDRYADPLTDNSPIWTVYMGAAEQSDRDRTQEWNRGLDTLALFSGIFSAVTSAFIIESYQSMQPDFNELTYRALSANFSGRTFEETPFAVPGPARAVNCIWVTSLIFSLAAGLLAIMGKDWIAAYRVPDRHNLREWSTLHLFRRRAVEQWHMPNLIASAPILLHFSLFLFVIGLSVFFSSVDGVTSGLTAALTAVAAMMYVAITFSDVVAPSSPFRSPSTSALRETIYRFVKWIISTSVSVGSLPRQFYVSQRSPASDRSQSRQDYFRRIVENITSISSRIRQLRNRLKLERELDLWYNALDEHTAFERAAADVIIFLCSSPPTLHAFLSVVHVFKDSDHGRNVSSLVSPFVRSWFEAGLNAFSPESLSPSNALRVFVAGGNLGLHINRNVQRYMMRAEESASQCPEEYAVGFLLAFRHELSEDELFRMVRYVPEQRATISRVIDLLDYPKRSYQTRVRVLISVLDRWRNMIWNDAPIVQRIVRMLEPEAQRLSNLNANSSQSHCGLIDILCYHLSSTDLLGAVGKGSAMQVLQHMCHMHRGTVFSPQCKDGHPSIASLFGGLDEHNSSILFDGSIQVSPLIAVLPPSRLSTLVEGEEYSESDRVKDLHLAKTLSGFMSAAHFEWVSGGEPPMHPFAPFVASFVPQDQEVSRKYNLHICGILRTLFSSRCIAVLQIDAQSFLALLYTVLQFLKNHSDPESKDASTLFVQMMRSQRVGGRDLYNWNLLEYLSGFVKSPEQASYISPILSTLESLRKIYKGFDEPHEIPVAQDGDVQ